MKEFPKNKTIGDALCEIISGAPGVGSQLLILISNTIGIPIEKRRIDWLNNLALAIEELQKQYTELSIDNLQKNEIFISTVMQASQIALRTHKEEKLKALRNAVLNSAISISIDEDTQTMFLSFIDTFTVSHIKILQFWNNPSKYKTEYSSIFDTPRFNNGTIMLRRLPEALFPDLMRSTEFHDQITNDLVQKGLIDAGQLVLNNVVACGFVFNSRTTSLGNNFIKYITSPIVE